jgi:hypothetical protein
VRGPGHRLEILEQPVGVVGDAEEPLLELTDLDDRAAALAAAVDHLLVGQHRGVLGTPVDRSLLAVGEPALEQAQEQPLRPAVVARLVGAELARPVDRDAPAPELLLELADGLSDGLAGMLSGLDRVVLGGEAEGVVAHRMQHRVALAAPEVRDRIAQGVVLQVADVRLARRVGQHLQHVGHGLVSSDRVVRDLPRVLVGPHPLPLGLYRTGVVALCHRISGG